MAEHKTDLVTYFFSELERAIEVETQNGAVTMTQGQALIRNALEGAVKGDQKSLGELLKITDKLEKLSATLRPAQEISPLADWHELFAFYGKYKRLIDAEIRKLKKENPDYWGFAWFKPDLKTAPWYRDLYQNK